MTTNKKHILFFCIFIPVLALTGCAKSSTIQRADNSESEFDSAVLYEGEKYSVGEDVEGAVEYRIFHQASTGFTSLQSIRVSATKRAEDFCEGKGKTMQAIKERTSVPPHILGNWPRIEIIFACVDKQKIEMPLQTNDDKYGQLRKLKSLLDDGVITQEEFELEKDKILRQ